MHFFSFSWILIWVHIYVTDTKCWLPPWHINFKTNPILPLRVKEILHMQYCYTFTHQFFSPSHIEIVWVSKMAGWTKRHMICQKWQQDLQQNEEYYNRVPKMINDLGWKYLRDSIGAHHDRTIQYAVFVFNWQPYRFLLFCQLVHFTSW